MSGGEQHTAGPLAFTDLLAHNGYLKVNQSVGVFWKGWRWPEERSVQVVSAASFMSHNDNQHGISFETGKAC